MNDDVATGDILLDTDRRHLIHPLHHPKEHAQARIFVEGRGAMLRTADGNEYIDGLSALWNVNAGHGRKELADVAAEQMARLAYASAYSGFSNEPADPPRGAYRRVAPIQQHGGGVLHHRRRRIQRERVQDRPLLLEADGQAEQGEDHLAPSTAITASRWRR